MVTRAEPGFLLPAGSWEPTFRLQGEILPARFRIISGLSLLPLPTLPVASVYHLTWHSRAELRGLGQVLYKWQTRALWKGSCSLDVGTSLPSGALVSGARGPGRQGRWVHRLPASAGRLTKHVTSSVSFSQEPLRPGRDFFLNIF